ncbi:MAG: anaerobic sulfatase maturase [Bacillota bacterium]
MHIKPFNIMVFPNGPVCNMDCKYCYYKNKVKLYEDKKTMKMSYELLDTFIKNYMSIHPGINIPFIWQGGEPTLRGLDFFKKAVLFQNKYLPDGKRYSNSIQTNGVNLDEEWIKLFKKEEFLVGLSLDGPENIHRYYRTDENRNTHFNKIIDNLKMLQKYNIDTNILCVVNNVNIKKPIEIYKFFKKLNVNYIQFIPLVELNNSNYLIKAEEYGDFLINFFDKWIQDGYGEIHIQIFEEILNAWYTGNTNTCYFHKECGNSLVLEHNGDLYTCDHFVNENNKLGNINQTTLRTLVTSAKRKEFGKNKLNNLSEKCNECKYYFICHGGCLKNRLSNNDYNNYLCKGYKKIFEYTEPYMEKIVNGIINRRHPLEIKNELNKYFNKK